MYKKIAILKPEQLSAKVIAERLNIKLFHWERTSEAIMYDDMDAIFIDSRASPQVQWQDFCHELGHLMLHAGNQSYMPPLFVEYQEWKANNFMYNACIPTFMLDALHIQNMTNKEIHTVQKLFNVEASFASKRLQRYIQNRNVLY